MPLTKVNEEKRLVSGFASLDNPDSQSDIVLAAASTRAFSRFRGNIREMHQPVAVGKMVDFREESFVDPKTGTTHKGVFVTVYVSKGAQSTWEKVLDGTLTGFSIGGNVLDADTEFDKAAGKSVRIIKDYELVELSLVDNPANQLANIFSFEKNADGSLDVTGMIADTKSEYTFYCKTDEIAKTSTEESLECTFCEQPMVNVGWFEYSTDSDKTEKMNAAVHKYLSSINEVQDTAINEGGVDVAEDTVEKDAQPNETTDEEVVEQGEAEREADSSVESEKTDLEKAAEEEVVDEAGAEDDAEATEDEVSEVDDAEDDLAKMFDELSEKITDSLEKNREALDGAIASVNEKVEKVVDELDGKVKELTEKHSQLSEKFNSIKDELGKMEKSISSLQSASAVKKSGDLGGESETVVEKNTTSTWGGHFLGVNSLRDN
jgi:chaperonin cofactor prefoldin